jgi:hypothetical protein
MSKTAKARTVTLDGELVGAFHEKLAARLKALLSLVLAQKTAGTGVFARPEADPGIVRLLRVLHKLEPEAGWLEKAMPAPMRRNLQLLRQFILGNGAEAAIKQSPLKGQYDEGYRLAVTGLVMRDAKGLDAGVARLLDSWGKTEEGRFLPYLNLPAIAFQRAALRIDLRTSIPEGLPNDHDVVRAADPQRPTTLFNLLPGAGRVATDPTLDWPSLLLDEPISAHVDAKPRGKSR